MTRTPAEIAAEAMEAFAHDGPLCDDYNLALAQVALSALEREGYVLVPVEPTERMRVAALQNHLPVFVGDLPLYEKLWRAMLSARPQDGGGA